MSLLNSDGTPVAPEKKHPKTWTVWKSNNQWYASDTNNHPSGIKVIEYRAYFEMLETVGDSVALINDGIIEVEKLETALALARKELELRAADQVLVQINQILEGNNEQSHRETQGDVAKLATE